MSSFRVLKIESLMLSFCIAGLLKFESAGDVDTAQAAANVVDIDIGFLIGEGRNRYGIVAHVSFCK